MGIDHDGAAFLRAARRTNVDFTRTCTIGRQRLTTDDAARDASDTADAFFLGLGATTVDALDYSDYEGATILHDLNQGGTPPGRAGAFSAVVDGGSLEHIFHVPNALRTMMELVEPGGHLLLINPVDGQVGHGLYQFGPELYHRALSEENGFHLELCLLKELGRRPWFDAVDPGALGRRVEPRTRSGAYLYVSARRIDADRPIFATPPSQSDYASAWQTGGSRVSSVAALGRRLPHRWRRLARSGRERALRTLGPRGAGLKPVDLDAIGPPSP